MCVPPVASQRDGARFNRAIDSIESHNQRLEQLRALFPSFQKIFLVRNRAAPQELTLRKHDAPAHATHSEARKSREPRHPNPLPQGERAHGRTASSPLAEGERNGVTGKPRANARPTSQGGRHVSHGGGASCRAPSCRGPGHQWAQAGAGVS
jgi:hypothetical protein